MREGVRYRRREGVEFNISLHFLVLRGTKTALKASFFIEMLSKPT